MMISNRYFAADRLGSCFMPMSSMISRSGLRYRASTLSSSLERFVVQEVADHVEDRAVEHDEALLDRLVADGLDQKALARARRAEQQHVAVLRG